MELQRKSNDNHLLDTAVLYVPSIINTFVNFFYRGNDFTLIIITLYYLCVRATVQLQGSSAKN